MHTSIKVAILLYVLLGMHIQALIAQSTFLDPRFGTGGYLLAEIPEELACREPYSHLANDVVLDARGNLIIVGEAITTVGPPEGCGDSSFYITRLLPDGSLDTNFGVNGGNVRKISVFDFFTAVGVQSTSRIIAAGVQNAVIEGGAVFNIALTGYTDNGEVDSSFGQDGHIELNLAGWTDDPTSNQVPRNLAIDQQDRVLIAGGVNGFERDGQFFLVRYLPDGILDSNFGNEGIVLTDFAAGDDEANALALLPDGKVVVAGYFANEVAIPSGIALAQYLPDGTLDASFGSGGKVTAPLGAINVATALVVQPDGKLVVAGNANPALGLGSGFALVRFLSNGSMDTSFGTNGIVVLDITQPPYTDLRLQYANAHDLVQLPDGGLVVGGTASHDGTARSDSDFAIARFSADGEVDTSFNTDGLVLTDFPPPPATFNSDNLYALAVQSDGKVVAVGDKFKVARYRTDTSVSMEEAPYVETAATLHAPFPNPSGKETTLRYTLVRPSSVTLGVYDVLGRQVASLADGLHSAGMHTVGFNAETLPAGVYFVRLVVEGHVHTQAMTLVR